MKTIPFFNKTIEQQQKIIQTKQNKPETRQKRKIRLLAWMDSPTCATGFGNVARYLLAGLQQTGLFDIFVLAINHMDIIVDSAQYPYHFIPARSLDPNDVYGLKLLEKILTEYRFDYLFVMNDTAVADQVVDKLQSIKNNNPFSTVFYFPIDQKDQARYVKMINFADAPVAFSQYAINCCSQYTKAKIDYNYIGIDKNIFKPIPKEQIKPFRRETFKVEDDDFLIVNVNRNSFRKDIAHNILCFSEFRKLVPNSKLYLHTAIVDKGAGSMAPLDLKKAIFSCGLEPGKDVMFPQNFNPARGVPFEVLNLIYNSADLVMSTHLGEGQGLTSIEALCANTIALLPDNTVSSELTENAAILYPCKEQVWTDGSSGFRPRGRTEDIVKQMLWIYNNRNSLVKDNSFLYDKFSWREIMKKWIEIFVSIETKKQTDKPIKNGEEL